MVHLEILVVRILIQEAGDTDTVLLRSLRNVIRRIVQFTKAFRGSRRVTAATRNATVSNGTFGVEAACLLVPPRKLVVDMMGRPH